MRRLLYAVVLAVAVLLPPSVPASAAPNADLYLTFDRAPSGQSGDGPWTEGCFADAASARSACIRTDGDGAIRRTEQRSDPAISFPEPGGGAAILYVPHTRKLNPGTRDFVLSAMVDLSAGEAGTGANVLQKGLFDSAGGQWKLQVDDGVPSCRIAGMRGGRKVALMVSGPSITGKGWVPLRCDRHDGRLTIIVGTLPPVTARGDAAMDIVNGDEVTIGGREAVRTDNDQLHGDVDNIYVNIAV